jgi:nucleoside-diphosphate-sugar epimerase
MIEILVMGGTEFVSSSLAKHLIDKGYTVDIFTRGMKPVRFEGVRYHIKGDRKSAKDLKTALWNKKYDYVFDISAYTKEDVEKLVGSLNKDKLKKYIFCSSGAVYNASNEMIKEDFPRGENANWGVYGRDKKEAEDYLLSMWESEKLPVVIFRPTYIYGEGNNLYRESYLFDRVTTGLAIPIPSGNTKTQFIHISDLVKSFESAMFCNAAIGKAYNITHPEIVSWEHWACVGAHAAGKEAEIKKIDLKDQIIKEREFFPFRDVTYLLDTRRADRDVLYMPILDLEKGMARTYKWYLEAKPKLDDKIMTKVEFILNQ